MIFVAIHLGSVRISVPWTHIDGMTLKVTQKARINAKWRSIVACRACASLIASLPDRLLSPTLSLDGGGGCSVCSSRGRRN